MTSWRQLGIWDTMGVGLAMPTMHKHRLGMPTGHMGAWAEGKCSMKNEGLGHPRAYAHAGNTHRAYMLRIHVAIEKYRVIGHTRRTYWSNPKSQNYRHHGHFRQASITGN